MSAGEQEMIAEYLSYHSKEERKKQKAKKIQKF